MTQIPKVLLIDPITEEGFNYEGEARKPPAPNMGLLCLATYISSRHDCQTDIIEMGAGRYSYEDVIKHIEEDPPDIVGITSMTFNVGGLYYLSQKIKFVSKKIIVLAGGHHPTALPEQTLSECKHIDAIVRGEGEKTLSEIVERLVNNIEDKDALFNGVTGISYRSSNGLLKSEPNREFITDIDKLPFPNFSLISLNHYEKVVNPLTGKKQMRWPVFYCRGCPFSCTFCMSPGKFRMRSPLKVVEEMELLNKNLGAEYFNLQGSGIYAFKKSPLNSNNKWYEDFFNQLVKRKLNEKIYWAFATRIDTAEPEMFIKAKEAGCVKVTLGIESGNEMILKKIKKKCTKKHIYDIVQSAKNSGIHSVHANFILGLPYETRETAGDTLEMIGSLPLDGVGVSILDIYPGTDVFDMVEKSEGGLNWLPGKRMNWESYTRLEVQVSVNDLTKDDLLDLREEALERWRAKKITGVDGQGNKQLVALIKFYRERLKQVAKLKNIYKTRLNQS